MIKVYFCDEISPISATVIDPKLNLSISLRNKKPAESWGAAPCRIIEQGNNEIWVGGRHQKRNDTICEQQSNHRGTNTGESRKSEPSLFSSELLFLKC